MFGFGVGGGVSFPKSDDTQKSRSKTALTRKARAVRTCCYLCRTDTHHHHHHHHPLPPLLLLPPSCCLFFSCNRLSATLIHPHPTPLAPRVGGESWRSGAVSGLSEQRRNHSVSQKGCMQDGIKVRRYAGRRGGERALTADPCQSGRSCISLLVSRRSLLPVCTVRYLAPCYPTSVAAAASLSLSLSFSRCRVVHAPWL